MLFFHNVSVYLFIFLNAVQKTVQEEDDEPSTSSNPVLELELTEEKLPMTLSRQEVNQFIVFNLAFQ